MSSLFDASGMEQPASIDGTLGRLGSSYLEADCILVGCPSRDAFLLPDDLEEPPAAPQHTTLSTAAGLQQHSQQPRGVGAAGPSRTPAGGPFSLAAGIHHRTPPSAHVLPNSNSSSIAWDNKPGAGMPPGLHGSRQTGARSPLLSARTAAALMSGEDDVQQAGLDLLDGPFSLPMVEGELLQWGTGGAQGLSTEGPPRGLSGFGPGSTARVGTWDGPTAGQQYHSQQQRLLHASFPAGYSSPPPAATSRQHGQHISPSAHHPRLQQQHQHQHLQPGAYVDHRSSPQQQLQPGVQAAAWQQQHMRMQMQQASLQQQRQMGASLGSSRPVARVLHPPGVQNGHFPAHVLQQQLQAHQHRQQQQQQQVQPQGRQHPALQQRWPAGSPPAAWQASAVGAAAGAQGHAGAAAMATAFPGPSKPDRPVGTQAALHTWGSNTSSMTAAVVDAATALPAAVTTAAGSNKADTPPDSTPVAASAAAGPAAGSDAPVQQPEQGAAPNTAAGLQGSASPSASAAAEGKAANTAAAAAGAKPGAASTAGKLAANTAAAASPGKDRPVPGGAGVTALSSANSGSMGDSSHDSSQTQQHDAGSTEPLPSTTGGSGAAAAAGAAAGVGPTAVPTDAEGGQEGAANQPRIFHHKGGGPCDHCGVMESPQWRRGPPAKPILCNACGTRYRRTHHLGPPIPSGGHAGGGRPSAAGGSSGRGSSGGSTPGRKRAAAAEALGPAPLPVNYAGGVHTGTRLARNPDRPAPKQYKLQDV